MGFKEKISAFAQKMAEKRQERNSASESVGSINDRLNFQSSPTGESQSYSSGFSSSVPRVGSKKLLKFLLVFLLIPIFPLVLIYNLVRTGKFFPNSEGKITGIIFSLLIVAAIFLVAYPVVAPFGLAGVRSTISQAFGFARDTAEEVSGGYIQYVQQSMGLSYASQIDRYADQEVGVSLNDVRLSQATYSNVDSVSIWGVIEGKSLAREREIRLNLACWHEKNLQGGGTTGRFDGRITPSNNIIIDRQISSDFRCDFPQGILAEQSTFPDVFNVQASFNFETMAYATYNFMDYEAFFTLERTDPSRVQDLRRQPVSQNTNAPVSIGMGSQQYPILITRDSMQVQPTIGFTITNRWNGYIKKINSFNVLVPRGINLVQCDAMTDLVPDQVQADEFFTNYTMVTDGLEHLSSRITTREGSTNRFVPQNFRCFLDFEPEIIFEERNRLDPISLNVFATLEYDYKYEQVISIPTLVENDVVNVLLTPSIVGMRSTPQVSISEAARGKQLQSARLTLRHRKRGEFNSTIVSEYSNMPLVRDAEGRFVGSINNPLESIISELGRGDTVIFEFNVVMDDGSSYRAMRSIRILNNPPELKDANSLYFSPTVPSVNDDILCVAEAIDPDGDDVMSTFSFRNRNTGVQRTGINGTCEETEDYWTCTAKMPADMGRNVNNVIECSVTLHDGVDFNRLTNRAETTISQETVEGSAISCVSTDGIDTSVRGTTTITDGDEQTEYVDECVDENTVREYFCQEDNTLGSRIFDCNAGCESGRCR